jgi:hypothetical protein
MKNSALLLWLITISAITFTTIYFFVKVLFVKPKSEPDSFTENDDVKR